MPPDRAGQHTPQLRPSDARRERKIATPQPAQVARISASTLVERSTMRAPALAFEPIRWRVLKLCS